MKSLIALSIGVSILLLLWVLHTTSSIAGDERDDSWSEEFVAKIFSSLELVDVQTHLSTIRSSDFPEAKNVPMEYLCLWTSGTYSSTGMWNWTDVDLSFTVDSEGNLEVEYINALCQNIAGYYSTAAAVYHPITEKRMGKYDLFASTYLGYLPALPSGWCWIFTIDYLWSGLPHSHGISVDADWASAINLGETVPPFIQACGWPLAYPPPVFTISGL
jgi:hypothetical protein